MMRTIAGWLAGIALAGVVAHAHGFELRTEQVAEGVYALLGPTGPRTRENFGLNANYGVIVTDAGVALVDSGTSAAAAKVLEAQVAKITAKRVRWVLNTGSQDHRWLGNAYFAGKGAEIIALRRTAATQREVGHQQLDQLAPVLGDQVNAVPPMTAPKPLEGDRVELDLGGRRVHLLWLGDAHFPGDAVVWLPQERVAFAGDIVFTDRLLGVLPLSRVRSWLEAFAALESLGPRHIVPGHGSVSGIAKAQRDTGDYLRWLIASLAPLASELQGVGVAVGKFGDAPQFARLLNYESLHKANVNRAYLQFESGQ
jgi:glyoxylase-like metal-dependent hydrolase (beta-lactamase superfamily II)